jgi:hypothetical protein
MRTLDPTKSEIAHEILEREMSIPFINKRMNGIVSLMPSAEEKNSQINVTL